MSISPPESLSSIHMSFVQAMKKDTVDKCQTCNKIGWLFDQPEPRQCDCLKKLNFMYRMLCSNIPETYREVSFEQYVFKEDVNFHQVQKYAQQIQKMKEKGLGLHLFNHAVGVGKTMLGVCVLLEAMDHGYWVWFTTMSRLLEDIRKSQNDPEWRKKIEWAAFQTDFLMIDELEKFNNTESGWLTDRINDLIQTRVNYMRPIITTGNVSLREISDKYQHHLISRMESRQIELLVGGTQDFRIENQKKEKNNLLKEL